MNPTPAQPNAITAIPDIYVRTTPIPSTSLASPAAQMPIPAQANAIIATMVISAHGMQEPRQPPAKKTMYAETASAQEPNIIPMAAASIPTVIFVALRTP